MVVYGCFSYLHSCLGKDRMHVTDNRNDLELDISNEYRIAQFQS
jgi:hypothetical protein